MGIFVKQVEKMNSKSGKEPLFTTMHGADKSLFKMHE